MTYRCQECGFESPKWMGFCPRCPNAAGLVEVAAAARTPAIAAPTPLPLSKASDGDVSRIATGMGEVDRVLGGGLVPGGVILVGGEPGVGKSTLLLQLAGALADAGGSTIIATAEESAHQVGLRARRLGVAADAITLLAEHDVDAIIAAAVEHRPDLVVVDSIQTVGVAEVGSAPGAVAQVREAAARLIRAAKHHGFAAVIVGHVTKDGGIAGPKLLEHMVDVVLYLEGETDRGFRTLHGLKNRFGATHVVGLFEMAGTGLAEVADPSAVFVADWQGSIPGTVIFPAMQGRRAMLVEVQALTAPSPLAQPRRSVRGIEVARVHQLLAVLARHAGLGFGDQDVYVNVVGGIRLAEPAVDLAVALALASSRLDRPLGALAAWGEVGLAGELRQVPHGSRRSEEVGRMGLDHQVYPGAGGPRRLIEALQSAGLKAAATGHE